MIPSAVMNLLKSHSWPGNIRELQNVIERGVILSRGTVLQVPLSNLMPRIMEDSYTSGVGTPEDVERNISSQFLNELGFRWPEWCGCALGA
jgi:formate hydrogenlyase transcriptional activator